MNVLAGDATIDQMYSLGLVRTPADFYSLTMGQLMMLEGWKERSARRFLDSLRSSLAVTFDHVLFALGIRFVGETTARAIAESFGDLDSIAAASIEQLLEVPDVGEVIACSVFDYFRDPRHMEEISRLKEAGLQFSMAQKDGPASEALSGMTVVISGNFSIPRDEMKRLIEANGGRNSGSVSGKTSFLLAGEKPGPEKIKKAAGLGIRIVSEKEFMDMLPSPGHALAAPAPGVTPAAEPDLFSGLED